MHLFSARSRIVWVAACVLLGLVTGATAGTITVNNPLDAYGGPTCSLRNAIRSVNTGIAYGGCQFTASIGLMIVIPAGTFQITRAIDINDPYAGGALQIGSVNVSVNGAGADQTVIDGGGLSNLFTLSGTGTFVYLYNMQLTGGGGDFGGAIHADGQGLALSLDHVLVRGNRANVGGGLGAANDGGTITITHSTFTDNEAAVTGGGLSIFGGNLTIENTTISDNRAGRVGGVFLGVPAPASVVRLNNVTIADNTSTVAHRPTLLIQGGSGLYAPTGYQGTVHISNSILAHNAAYGRVTGTNFSADCAGISLLSDDYNLFGFGPSSPCPIVGSTVHSYLNADPKLLSLFSYGGHMPTRAISLDSPARNSGNPATCASDDERGVSRTSDTCDIGAYELHADFTVNSTLDANDSGINGSCDTGPPNHLCTLRAALDEANAASSARTIVVPEGMYTLSVPLTANLNNSGALFVNNPDAILILGEGADKTRIRSLAANPSIFASHTRLALAHLAISGTGAPLGGMSLVDGTIVLSSANALLEEISVSGASGCVGGAVTTNVRAGGTSELQIERSSFADNRAYGCVGATFNNGGAISADSASVHIRNSTLSHNRADNSGGGIYATNSTVYLSQNTIADNVANLSGANLGSGGGVALDPLNGGSFVMAGTLLADNRRVVGANFIPDDCAGLLVSRDQNLIGNPIGCTIAGSVGNTLQNMDPLLSPLAAQGGTMKTQGLQATSPALNAIPDRYCVDVFGNAIATDQRVYARNSFSDDSSTRCDIGAFEGVSEVIFADGYD